MLTEFEKMGLQDKVNCFKMMTKFNRTDEILVKREQLKEMTTMLDADQKELALISEKTQEIQQYYEDLKN